MSIRKTILCVNEIEVITQDQNILLTHVKFKIKMVQSLIRGLRNTMQIHEHRGFNIEIHKVDEGYVPEIYRKGKLIHTVSHKDRQFQSQALAIEAARQWIDKT